MLQGPKPISERPFFRFQGTPPGLPRGSVPELTLCRLLLRLHKTPFVKEKHHIENSAGQVPHISESDERIW